MCDDINNCCRICLDVKSNHVSILADPTINLHLRSCLAIIVTANDQLPKNICLTCVSQLTQFYNFQINARYSQDWLETSLQVKSKKHVESKAPIQPLPDSEYNSDSLLEFLNNTENIEDYLNNLGKEDIPSIVNMLDKNENAIELTKVTNLKIKHPSPKKKEIKPKNKIEMEIDVLDSDIDIVKEIIMKEVDPKNKVMSAKCDKNFFTCYGCKLKFDGIQKLSQHVSTCDSASRTCVKCDSLFDSRQKMIEHSSAHTLLPLHCICGKDFYNKESLCHHQKICRADYGTTLGCSFKCKECGEIFEDRFQLYRHARVHIMKAEEKKCDICSHIFVGNEALANHMLTKHDKPKGAVYRCKVCNLTLPDHKQMYLHVKGHTTKSEPTRHLCESCGKSFSTRAILMRHSLQHNKNFQCNVCSKYLSNQKEKDEHMTEHSEMTMCEKCGKSVNFFQFEAHFCCVNL